jgi:LysR family transcriptional regulator, hypochlorite-specific transcription factor HypT
VELNWLEDFLSLAETGSFSRSAQLRHVTQPAFSRRIRALESWVGAALVDRTSYPTKLTPSGEAFKEAAAVILRDLYDARAMVRGSRPIPADTLEFAVPHALSLGFYPRWLTKVERGFGSFGCKLVALNVHDAVMSLVEGHCDLLMCYHHPQQPIQLDEMRYQMLPLGSEQIRPYAKVTKTGSPMYRLPGTVEHPVPYLAYSPNAFLGRIVDVIVENARTPHHLRRRYETDMAEALKVMAIEGHGIAWLPDSALATGNPGAKSRNLVAAGDDRWSGEVEIRLYRDRTQNKPLLDRLWTYLSGQNTARSKTMRQTHK